MISTTLTKQEATFHPLLDSDYLLEFYEADLEDILWAIQTFCNFTLKDFYKLLPLAKAKDWEGVKQIAHKVKPNFKLVGFTRFYEVLLQIEVAKFNKAEVVQQTLLTIIDLDKEIRNIYIPILEMEMKRLDQYLNQHN